MNMQAAAATICKQRQYVSSKQQYVSKQQYASKQQYEYVSNNNMYMYM
jgi:hypothetical protein